MRDILKELYANFPYSKNQVKSFAVGQKYVAVMLTNGNIGVSATLMNSIKSSPHSMLSNPNFSNYEHRIVVNAWVNANINYSEPTNGKADIFDAIDFSAFKSLVMVGYFGSLVQKFVDKGIKITVFDLNEQDVPVEPIAHQKESIANADGIILTATTLANNTFPNLISYTNSHTKVYMLGSSTPLTRQIMDMHSGVLGLFGAKFTPYDSEVLHRIEQGGGTRTFLHRMEKVYLLRD